MFRPGLVRAAVAPLERTRENATIPRYSKFTWFEDFRGNLVKGKEQRPESNLGSKGGKDVGDGEVPNEGWEDHVNDCLECLDGIRSMIAAGDPFRRLRPPQKHAKEVIVRNQGVEKTVLTYDSVLQSRMSRVCEAAEMYRYEKLSEVWLFLQLFDEEALL
ncbi:hypothetical protein PM082_003095 [Marasmius tenuissimus]|nr:hypothetical protein PM082_003095 [Marasmius tenuissimus]